MPSGSNTRRRWTTRIALAAAVSCLFVVVGASPAGAIVTEVPTLAGTVKIGAQPRSTELFAGAPVGKFANGELVNGEGHPVMHSNATYAIYWDPAYYYHGDWQHLIDTFLQNVGSESGTLGDVFSIDEQYTDKSNQRAAYTSSFRGAYVDTNGYPKTKNCTDPDTLFTYPDKEAEKDNIACITDKQIREQLEEFITKHGLQTGMGTVFFLLTPPGVTVCADEGGVATSHCSDTLESANGFCSYHSAISPTNPTEGNAETILYDVIPWSAGGLGDANLHDQAPGYECQDGGLDPTSKPTEKPESPRHQQEPNQLPVGTRGPDGSFDTGLADLIINQVAVELQNTITDPLLNAWQDSAGNEAVDECRNFFALTLGGSVGTQENTEAGTLFNQSIGSGHYYLNDAFNLAALNQHYPGIPCLPGARLEPQFTAPNPVNTKELVGFDAAESNVTLDSGTGFNANAEPYETFPTYTWNFGDGTHTTSAYPPGASQTDEPSVFHSYEYGGTYTVTLTVTDVGGNTESTSRAITVDGPPPPPPPPTTPSGTSTGSTSTATGTTAGAGTSTGTTTGSGSTAGSTASTALAAPTVTDSAMSRSLKKVASLGLALRYTVNEQVAGRVEAILDAATARRLHIEARAALGLPQGYPKSVVVGQAVLVTTMGGHGVVRVRFSKTVAKRLAHAGHVTLTLRFVVRNASRTSPQTTTTLSKVVLSH